MPELDRGSRIVLTGGAGLVGRNLCSQLVAQGYTNLLVLDRAARSLDELKTQQPEVEVLHADLSQEGPWQDALVGADVVVQMQAEITSIDPEAFVTHTLHSTQHVLAACKHHGVSFVVHLSSSVVLSKADDDYVRSKTAQEKAVKDSGLRQCTLRPTLLFGPHDGKHLAWLAGFMKRSPLFPIPGAGRFVRQPLYVKDLCRAIRWCMDNQPDGALYDVTGETAIEYKELIRTIRRHAKGRALILSIPKPLFRALLKAYALLVSKPPFTSDQLDALTVGDYFGGVDFQTTFGFPQTPLHDALQETFSQMAEQ